MSNSTKKEGSRKNTNISRKESNMASNSAKKEEENKNIGPDENKIGTEESIE